MVLLLLHHIEVGYILLVGPKVHAAVRVDPVLGLLVHEVGVVHVGQLAECRLDLMSLLLNNQRPLRNSPRVSPS